MQRLLFDSPHVPVLVLDLVHHVVEGGVVLVDDVLLEAGQEGLLAAAAGSETRLEVLLFLVVFALVLMLVVVGVLGATALVLLVGVGHLQQVGGPSRAPQMRVTIYIYNLGQDFGLIF